MRQIQVWSYWDKPKVPTFVERFRKSWSKYLDPKIYNVCILNFEEGVAVVKEVALGFELPASNLQYDTMTPQMFSDLVRLSLLWKHGGIWMDAGVMLLQDLSWVVEKFHNFSYVGYYIAATDIIENWFMAIRDKQHTALKIWFCSFFNIILETNSGKLSPKRSHTWKSVSHKDIPGPEYLTMHVAFRVAMKNSNVVQQFWKNDMHLRDAAVGPLMLFSSSNWNRYALGKNISSADEIHKQTELVKFVSVSNLKKKHLYPVTHQLIDTHCGCSADVVSHTPIIITCFIIATAVAILVLGTSYSCRNSRTRTHITEYVK